MKTIIMTTVGVFAAMLLGGCAGNQPMPQAVQNGKLKKAKPGKGMLYVYRPSSFIGGAVYYDVHDGAQKDKVLGTIVSGSVIASELKPGTHEIWAKTEAKVGVPVSIRSGTTQCVKAGVGMGLFIGRPELQKIDLQTCRYDIKKIVEEKKKREAEELRQKGRKDSLGLPR